MYPCLPCATTNMIIAQLKRWLDNSLSIGDEVTVSTLTDVDAVQIQKALH